MKGNLVQIEDNQWYIIKIEEGIEWEIGYPLHPDDVNFCNSYSNCSIEWIGREVDFEIVENKKMSGISVYAKML